MFHNGFLPLANDITNFTTAPRIKRHRSKPNRKAWFPIRACQLSLRSCLSWISSTLTEFQQRNFVPIASICSLSGINAVQKFALLGLLQAQFLCELLIFRSRTGCFTTGSYLSQTILIYPNCSSIYIIYWNKWCKLFRRVLNYVYHFNQTLKPNNNQYFSLYIDHVIYIHRCPLKLLKIDLCIDDSIL